MINQSKKSGIRTLHLLPDSDRIQVSAEGGGEEGKGKLLNSKSNNISGQMSMNLKLQQFFSIQTL